ncbi:protealysin inhibitor emfourin [Lonsdalea quercina]|uniref:protealysin inhibitor emfourin n=1 Tax=Lonsdalea quercina TaxID=71657 RepID=UPI0039748EE9
MSMNAQPHLSDDAIIELAREGGLAWIPKLSGPRWVVLAKLPAEERKKICAILRSVLPPTQTDDPADPPGRGDQFYYRIHIFHGDSDSGGAPPQVWLVPERAAPELDALWQNAQPAP